MNTQNPTLLIGLGAFGRAVVARAVPPELRPADDASSREAPAGEGAARAAVTGLEIMAVDDGALDADALAAEAEARCRRLLALGHFVDTTAPTDARGPRLDVLVVADLGEAPLAAAISAVVSALGWHLRGCFRPILRAGEGALVVCPLLLLPRGAGGAAAAVHALAALARDPDQARRPGARIYLVEEQSGKYLLPRDELTRCFAAFLHLLLFSRLRDEQGVRSLVEVPDDERVEPIATFVCATMEVDMAALHELCALALARDILACYAGDVPSLAEVAAEAGALVAQQTTVEGRLWQEGEQRTLESYLTPPAIAVPGIDWSDAPEDITERKLGALWRLDCARAMDAFRHRVEHLQMDRLAAQIEHNGTALAGELDARVCDRLRDELAVGPRGLARALELARYAGATARGLRDAARARIDAPDLPRFPPSPLDACTAAVHEAAASWPRREPARMRLLGGVAVALGTLVLGSLVHLAAAAIGPAWPASPLPWWASAAAGLLVALSGVRYALWRHGKQHHNWLCQARDALDQAVERYLHRDVIDYFRRRLDYTRALWVYRIYRQSAARLDGLVARMNAGRAALAEAGRVVAAREHERVARLGEPASGAGGILYRRLLQPDVVQAFYRHVRPADVSAAALRFHEQAVAAGDPLDAPFADLERLLAFCRRELEPVRTIAPYEPDGSPLAEAVAAGVREHLRRLALKLSPPLELAPAHAAEAPPPQRMVIAPPEARALVDASLEPLDQSWRVRSHSGDPQRIHLLLERGGLPVAAVAGLEAGQGPGLEPGLGVGVEAAQGMGLEAGATEPGAMSREGGRGAGEGAG